MKKLFIIIGILAAIFFGMMIYKNMANKGNDRSNARISDTQILDTLKTKGSVKTYSEQFKAFTTGKSEHLDNEERLFVCKCN